MLPEQTSPSRRRSEPPTPVESGGRLCGATRLGSEAMLCVVSDLPGPVKGRIGAWLAGARRSQRLIGMRLASADGPDAAGEVLLALKPARDHEHVEHEGSLIISTRDFAVSLDPADVREVITDLPSFASHHLDHLDRTQRIDLLERVRTFSVRGEAGTTAASTHLVELRDAVRATLPEAEAAPAALFAAHVDAIWRVDVAGFYVEGWVLDRHRTLSRLSLISPEGQTVDITEWMFRYRRSDVSEYFSVRSTDRLGFVAYVELPEPSPFNAGWILEAELAGRSAAEFRLPDVLDEPLHLRSTLLDDIDLETPTPTDLLVRHVSPALGHLQRRLTSRVAIDTIDQHGAPPEAPAVSIIVPLYRRVDFLEHQLAQFSLDPTLHAADLIYVLDSPEDNLQLRPVAEQLYDLYRIPFRVAVVNSNAGYSRANNLGAALARARLLLLLNSDVFPREPGWLSRMAAFYDATPRIGVLGPKLLYEDDSIQHAGVYFDRSPSEATWANEHFFKGFHRLFAPANVAREVPAVTGACMMIATELFNRMRGFGGSYIRGDYEDTDLCLRLASEGLSSWYLPDVELYHLEGQSYADADRERASRYNRWLHTHLWREQLSRHEEASG